METIVVKAQLRSDNVPVLYVLHTVALKKNSLTNIG